MLHDLRLAVRSLLRARAFTITTVLTLSKVAAVAPGWSMSLTGAGEAVVLAHSFWMSRFAGRYHARAARLPR